MGLPARTDNQVRAVAYALKNPYCILALDPRLGKTRVAIDVREELKCNCLVISPGYLVSNWVKEIKLWAPSASVTPIYSGKQIREICDTDYILISYDLAQKAPHLFEWADMVVIEEGHNLKSMKAKRTQFVHRHVYENSIKRMMILTGTPIKNRVQEFYSLLALCFYNPAAPDSQFLDKFPSEIDFADYFSFREEYTIEIKNKFVTIVKWNGIRRTKELKRWLKGRYLRIKASEADLPPVSYLPILISNTDNHKLKEVFDKHFAADGADSVAPDVKVEAAVQKVPFTVKYAKDLLESQECVLIYTDHVEPAKRIAMEFGVTAITGEMPANRRTRMADAFQAGEGRVLVATIGSLKEGKDLFRSDNIIFNDYCWVPGDFKQVVNRIRAMGKKVKCTVHQILGSPQDEYILDTIKEKIKTIEEAT